MDVNDGDAVFFVLQDGNSGKLLADKLHTTELIDDALRFDSEAAARETGETWRSYYASLRVCLIQRADGQIALSNRATIE